MYTEKINSKIIRHKKSLNKSLNSLGRDNNSKHVPTSQNSLTKYKAKIVRLTERHSNITLGYFYSIFIYERAGMCPSY